MRIMQFLSSFNPHTPRHPGGYTFHFQFIHQSVAAVEMNFQGDVLPPIRFINFNVFKKREEFPRYPNNADETVIFDDINRSKSLLVFISHCWISGYDGASDWRGYPHPDNIGNDKFRLCVNGIEKSWRLQAPLMEQCFVWLDYGCINQDGDPAGELKQLDKIVQSCDFIFTPIVDHNHGEWKLENVWRGMLEAYDASAWRHGPHSYVNRAWCRMEMFYAAHVPMLEGSDEKDRQVKFAAGLKNAADCGRRPHLLYGTREDAGAFFCFTVDDQTRPFCEHSRWRLLDLLCSVCIILLGT